MARSAKVTSIDAVQRFAGMLRLFQEEASAALENLGVEVQRATDWVQGERKTYWSTQARRAYETLGEAKADLQRKQVYNRIGDHQPSCIEEKRAMERAKRRERVTREKIEAVRHWSQAVDRASTEYQGSITQLATWLDAECPRALAALGRMSDALHAYAALGSTASVAETAAASAARAAVEALAEPAPQPSPQEGESDAPDAAAEEETAEESSP